MNEWKDKKDWVKNMYEKEEWLKWKWMNVNYFEWFDDFLFWDTAETLSTRIWSNDRSNVHSIAM